MRCRASRSRAVHPRAVHARVVRSRRCDYMRAGEQRARERAESRARELVPVEWIVPRPCRNPRDSFRHARQSAPLNCQKRSHLTRARLTRTRFTRVLFARAGAITCARVNSVCANRSQPRSRAASQPRSRAAVQPRRRAAAPPLLGPWLQPMGVRPQQRWDLGEPLQRIPHDRGVDLAPSEPGWI